MIKKKNVLTIVSILIILSIVSVIFIGCANKAKTEIKYNVVVDNKIQNGKITVNPTSTIDGEIITVTVKPYENYTLTKGSIRVSYLDGTDGAEIIVSEDNTFVMPKKDVEVTANFEAVEKEYKITINELESGSIEVDKVNPKAGEIVTIIIFPKENYIVKLVTVKEDGKEEIENNHTGEPGHFNYTFIMPQGNVTISVDTELSVV